MNRLAERLVAQRLGERRGSRVILIDKLCCKEIETLAVKLAADTVLSFDRAAGGDFVACTYLQRFALALGPFAMLDYGGAFNRCPGRPRSKSNSAGMSPVSPAMAQGSTGVLAASAPWPLTTGTRNDAMPARKSSGVRSFPSLSPC